MAVRLVTKSVSSGYTIVELLTVVAITAVLSVLAVQILFQGQLRSNQADAVSRLRQEGNFVLDQMSFHLRNGIGADCTSGTEVVVTTQNGSNITFRQVNDYIASGSARLTSTNVTVEEFVLSCTDQTAGSGALINILLRLSSPELTSSTPGFNQEFSTSVYVRSY
jgi:prepilin-type N-terminal cleavage/methylation domain-containing protein